MSWISDVRFELARLDVSPGKLRIFGVVTGTIFLVIAFWLFYRKLLPIPALTVGSFALFLIATGASVPMWLRGIYRVWMGLAFALGWVMSRVLLTLLFFLVLMPIGWIARLAGEDFLDLRRSSGKQSFWVKRSDTKNDYEKMF